MSSLSLIRANNHFTYIIVDLTDTTKRVIVSVQRSRKYKMIYDPIHVNKDDNAERKCKKGLHMLIPKQLEF